MISVDLNQIVAKMIQTPHGPPNVPAASGSPTSIPGSRP